MNVYVYVYGGLTNTHGGTKRELRQWDNPHISVTPKTNRASNMAGVVSIEKSGFDKEEMPIFVAPYEGKIDP